VIRSSADFQPFFTISHAGWATNANLVLVFLEIGKGDQEESAELGDVLVSDDARPHLRV
jgi:hypothetical protein